MATARQSIAIGNQGAFPGGMPMSFGGDDSSIGPRSSAKPLIYALGIIDAINFPGIGRFRRGIRTAATSRGAVSGRSRKNSGVGAGQAGEHDVLFECAVEQRLARQAHNLEVVGSIPAGATP